MAQELAGKVAIVTGGAGGIGGATVELFVEEGAKVVIADVNEAQGSALASKLGSATRFKRADVSSEDDVQALVDFAVAEFGGLHVMFNNAGISSAMATSLLDIEFKDFERVMGVNVLGVMLGTQRAARHMAKHGGGSIINTASIAATLAGFGPMTYRASKAAVVQFSKSAAIALGQHNIRVNCIVPGNIVTEMIVSAFGPGIARDKITPEKMQQIDKAYRETMMEGQPLKRQGRPRDAAQLALFFASDRSLQMTGTVLPVDGGITAGDPVNHAGKILAARAKVLAS